MMKKTTFLLLILFLSACTEPTRGVFMHESSLQERLKRISVAQGDPVFIRIFKEERILEIWYERNGKYRLFTNYPVCYFSGGLGPKKKQGDKMSPEGFYRVTQKSLNPYSQYYRSFDLGFPNQYDRFKGYTGDYLMVHGDCISVGCYAMTDDQMDEIYKLTEASLRNGQQYVPVHVFPFKMTNERLARERNSPHYSFWLELKEGYDYFEKYRRVPNVGTNSGKYAIIS